LITLSACAINYQTTTNCDIDHWGKLPEHQ